MLFEFKCPDGLEIEVIALTGAERFKEMLDYHGISYKVIKYGS